MSQEVEEGGSHVEICRKSILGIGRSKSPGPEARPCLGLWGCGSETGEKRTDENFNLLVKAWQVQLMPLDVFVISLLRCEFRTYC